MTYINEPVLTDHLSVFEMIDERSTSTSLSGETHTPLATSNNSYELNELIDSAEAYSCSPSRNVNLTYGTPSSNADVYVDPYSGKVFHHPDDDGITFTWSYYGRGSACRALEKNQKRTALMTAYNYAGQGMAWVRSGEKKVDFEEINAMVGGLLVTWSGGYADLSSGGNCEFPDTTNGKWRAGAIWLKRSSASSPTGILDATWSEDEAATQGACIDPPPLEKAYCLGIVYAQSTGSGVGSCGNIAESQIRRIAGNTAHRVDSEGDDDGIVVPDPVLYPCDADVQRGDTVTWYKDANGFSRINSTLKKANSTNTPFHDPEGNNTNMPVIGIAGKKPDGVDGTECYLITGGNAVFINSGANTIGKGFYQCIGSEGNVTGTQPTSRGDWVQHIAYGTGNGSYYKLAIGNMWQYGYDTPDDPDDPEDPDPWIPGTTFMANVSSGSATYELVYIHHWTDYYAVCYRAKADNPTNCPTPFMSIGGPNDTAHAPAPPTGGIYGIIVNVSGDYNSTLKTVEIMMIPTVNQRLIPIDSMNETWCSWGTNASPIFVSADDAGRLTKTRPKGYNQVVCELGKDTGGFMPLSPGDNETEFWGLAWDWYINNYTLEPEPPGIWVHCDPNVTVDDWIGIAPGAVTRTRFTKAYNDISSWSPVGAMGVCTFKDPNNASLCKMLSQGYWHFSDANYSINGSSRYYLANTSGNMTTDMPPLTSIEQIPTQFSQLLGWGFNPTSDDPNAYNFLINIDGGIPDVHDTCGNRNQKYHITLPDRSDSGSKMTGSQTIYWNTGGSKVLITSIQIGCLENAGNDSSGGSISLSAYDMENSTALFSTKPNISADAPLRSSTYADNGSITAGVLNATNCANVSGLVRFTIEYNGAYTGGSEPYNCIIQVGYVPVG